MADSFSPVSSPMVANLLGTIDTLIKEEFISLLGLTPALHALNDYLKSTVAVLEVAEDMQPDHPILRNWLPVVQHAAHDMQDLLDTLATEASLWNGKKRLGGSRPPLSVKKSYSKLESLRGIKEISNILQNIIASYSSNIDKFHVKRSRKIRRLTSIIVDLTSLGLNKSTLAGFKTTTLAQLANNDERADPEGFKKDRFTRPFVGQRTFVGRQADKKKIIDLLITDGSELEDDLSIIPILGVGGVGKTTLAHLIYNDERVKEHFGLSRTWVHIADDFNPTRILREMLESYSNPSFPNDLSPAQVESYFRDFLSGKRFLLVLDDISSENSGDWKYLLELLELGGKGSKVLVTTRRKEAAELVSTHPPCVLGCLPEHESWSLFKEVAFPEGDMASEWKELEDVGRMIVQKCHGLPLAVTVIGSLLHGNINVREWRNVMGSNIWNLEGQYSGILPALKLSYYHLPSNLKQCFELLSIFPKAYAFRKEDLIKLWMAEGFLRPTGQERAEDIGKRYINELLARSFLQLSRMNDVFRIHDLFHDLALSISSTYCCQVKDNVLAISKNIRHMALLCHDVEQPLLQIAHRFNKLHTLLLPYNELKDFGKALDDVFQKLKYIRVLDLSSSMLLELPSSIKELKLLRYLDLSTTEIEELPDSICNLYNLETLKLLGCVSLFKLPENFGNLVNLQYLELDELFWFKCAELPPRMGNLTHLQNLHAFPIGRQESGHGIDQLMNIANLTGALHISKIENAVNARDAKLLEKESLQKLVLEWSKIDQTPDDEASQERILEDLLPHSNITELEICKYKGNSLPSWMGDALLQNLVSIRLNHCTKCKILTLGHLPNLRTLHIKGLLQLEEWPNATYPSLSRLTITSCPKLKSLPDIFTELRVLKIKSCSSIKAIPVTPTLMFLILVDNPSLEHWSQSIVSISSTDDQEQHATQNQFSLFNLLELTIIRCPKVSALPQCFAPRKLVIEGCDKLTSLPTAEFAQHLQHLALETCKDVTLLREIPNTHSLKSLIISNIANLVFFPKWPQLPGLDALYIHSCNELLSLSQVDEEDQEGELQSLTSLKLLSVKDCPNLVMLDKEGLPSSLECLSISNCPKLQSVGHDETLKHITLLRDLYIENCPLIHPFPKGGLPASIQNLHIQACPMIRSNLHQACMEESTSDQPMKKLSSAPWWYRHFLCGSETSDNGDIKEQSLDRAERDTILARRNERREPSTSVDYRNQVNVEHPPMSEECTYDADAKGKGKIQNGEVTIDDGDSGDSSSDDSSSSDKDEGESRHNHVGNVPREERGPVEPIDLGDGIEQTSSGAVMDNKDDADLDCQSRGYQNDLQAETILSLTQSADSQLAPHASASSQTSRNYEGIPLPGTFHSRIKDESYSDFHGFRVLTSHVPYLEGIHNLENNFWNSSIYRGQASISSQLDVLGEALSIMNTTWNSLTVNDLEFVIHSIEDALAAKFRVECLKGYAEKAQIALNAHKRQRCNAIETEITSLESRLGVLRSELQNLKKELSSDTRELDLGSNCLNGFIPE